MLTANLRLMPSVVEKLFPILSAFTSASSEIASSSASVAPGMNAFGDRIPDCGCRQRANSSTPASCFLRRSILGWHQNSIQPLLKASSSRTRAATGAGWPSFNCRTIAMMVEVSNGFFSTGNI